MCTVTIPWISGSRPFSNYSPHRRRAEHTCRSYTIWIWKSPSPSVIRIGRCMGPASNPESYIRRSLQYLEEYAQPFPDSACNWDIPPFLFFLYCSVTFRLAYNGCWATSNIWPRAKSDPRKGETFSNVVHVPCATYRWSLTRRPAPAGGGGGGRGKIVWLWTWEPLPQASVHPFSVCSSQWGSQRSQKSDEQAIHVEQNTLIQHNGQRFSGLIGGKTDCVCETHIWSFCTWIIIYVIDALLRCMLHCRQIG